ncbi:hypothetical protein L208DRAFT_1295167 [Tricholoma matsutake]|nr:hypothetical protein L208DRAFT_1295167 [Tricholoma matsutake 945]
MTKIENSLKESVKGAYATIQEDGWKSLSKKHLVAFIYTATMTGTPYQCLRHDSTPEDRAKLAQ